MKFPLNFKKYLLIGLLIFYMFIIISYYCSKMQEGLDDMSSLSTIPSLTGNTKSSGTSISSENSTVTITPEQMNVINKNLGVVNSILNPPPITSGSKITSGSSSKLASDSN
jgi:hypothetical protein